MLKKFRQFSEAIEKAIVSAIAINPLIIEFILAPTSQMTLTALQNSIEALDLERRKRRELESDVVALVGAYPLALEYIRRPSEAVAISAFENAGEYAQEIAEMIWRKGITNSGPWMNDKGKKIKAMILEDMPSLFANRFEPIDGAALARLSKEREASFVRPIRD